jgi:hypothetical protein
MPPDINQPSNIVQFQKKEEAKYICSACGADRGCNCNAPAVEKLAQKQEQDRQRSKEYRARKAEENQHSRHVTEFDKTKVEADDAEASGEKRGQYSAETDTEAPDEVEEQPAKTSRRSKVQIQLDRFMHAARVIGNWEMFIESVEEKLVSKSLTPAQANEAISPLQDTHRALFHLIECIRDAGNPTSPSAEPEPKPDAEPPPSGPSGEPEPKVEEPADPADRDLRNYWDRSQDPKLTPPAQAETVSSNETVTEAKVDAGTIEETTAPTIDCALNIPEFLIQAARQRHPVASAPQDTPVPITPPSPAPAPTPSPPPPISPSPKLTEPS